MNGSDSDRTRLVALTGWPFLLRVKELGINGNELYDRDWYWSGWHDADQLVVAFPDSPLICIKTEN